MLVRLQLTFVHFSTADPDLYTTKVSSHFLMGLKTQFCASFVELQVGRYVPVQFSYRVILTLYLCALRKLVDLVIETILRSKKLFLLLLQF